ncbi:hypothetical protein BV210_11720 [Halorientalis sp. IM1011]|uniref:glycosyltransferase n=1 Tax=Halorientalis sp. IM1011 TaxID=1932360 RepID=UPI00097CC95A|nr:glycosyltransferase [Halorientalis sp. IM1011]AQL43318.1 hypothetical protein BV210_11720 [Halorientalis sp. IM1011]
MTHDDADGEGHSLSVVCSTYRGDDPDELTTALESVFEQTRPPDEVVLVADGPVPSDIDAVIDRFLDAHPSVLRVERLPENRGRGEARRVGVEAASHKLVALMDADDVCAPTRFERQLDFLDEHPDIDVVGSYLSEFVESPDDPVAVREVPPGHEDIAKRARHRNPINQTTVVFRRDMALSAGNYRNVDRMEDYGLWVRMLLEGATFANIPETLVAARAGEGMYRRRGGIDYARAELRLQYEFWRWGFLGPARVLANLCTRVPLRLVPNHVRGAVYELLFRRGP